MHLYLHIVYTLDIKKSLFISFMKTMNQMLRKIKGSNLHTEFGSNPSPVSSESSPPRLTYESRILSAEIRGVESKLA
jgi:hypothetical protein